MIPWLACRPEPAPPPDVPRAALERSALREAEPRVLSDEARRALAAGDPATAARVVAVERATYPEVFEPLAAEVRASGDPEAIGLLGGPPDPGAQVARAFGPSLAATRARAAGATVPYGQAIWAGVSQTWVDPVDEAAVAAEVREQLGRIAADPGFRASWGPVEVPPGDRVAALLGGLRGAHWPEDVGTVAIVDAATAALDPWTRPVWPSERVAWEAHFAGVSLGIGVDLTAAPSGAVVVAMPEVGGPAWQAGVHAGDTLLAVDGRRPDGVPAAESALAGPPGSVVRLTLERADQERTIPVTRGVVPETTVFGWRRDGEGWDPWAREGVAWVRISAFRPDTDEAFDALTEHLGPEVLVLDLRGNGGGDLGAALHVADRLVGDGPLVHLEGRTLSEPAPGPNGELPWNVAAPGHALEGTPVVVLVDGRTASAAEIVAAILHERAGAVVLGEPTFGKLRSQALRDDPATGAAWQVTTGRWRVGAPLERVEPDLALPLTPAERRNADELTLRRELPAVHPDGSPLVWVGEVARRDLPTLSEDPWVPWALRLAGGLRPR